MSAPDDIVPRLRLWAEGVEKQKAVVLAVAITEAADEIERLSAELVSTTNRLTAERDEARREWCRLWGHTQGRNVAPTQAARLRAWDCFTKGNR